jgi:hypothetical protein
MSIKYFLIPFLTFAYPSSVSFKDKLEYVSGLKYGRCNPITEEGEAVLETPATRTNTHALAQLLVTNVPEAV